ncbi:hypothetical protein [Yoonia sp.]|uniref:hypothetical protein n=1 Tax=Yoonia sp. TaxID=2212373 RepID=UPI0023B495B4
MHPTMIALPFLVLAACATPREQCIDSVTQDTRVLASLIAQSEGNLARGYAIEQRQSLRTVVGTCRGRNEDGSDFFFACDETNTITTNVPVAIDLRAEQAKLASLQQRFVAAQAASNAAVAQCIAQNPE